MQSQTRTLHILLASIVLLALGNVFGAAITRHPERDLRITGHVNFALTLVAGLVINLGTIIQVASLLRSRRQGEESKIHQDYTVCLVAGCFLLVVCQLYAYAIGQNANVEFLCTLATSVLSFVCTSALWLIGRYRHCPTAIEITDL